MRHLENVPTFLAGPPTIHDCLCLCGLSFHQVCGQSLCLAGNTASASAPRARQRPSAGGWHFVK